MKRFISAWIIVSFIATSMPGPIYAQGTLNLPAPGTMINLSPAFAPILIKGLKVHPENPLLFDFILDTGRSGLKINSPAFKAESEKLIKYFLAALTIKEDDLWVNLSPYEKDRMVPNELGKTQLGQDMLAQDYILKQLTASLIYPEKQLGKEFWNRIYTKAQQMYGTANVPVNTFNKVWIIADKARILERNNVGYVVGAHLKVMLEEDYLALEKHNVIASKAKQSFNKIATSPSAPRNDTNSIASQLVRSLILPELEKEVNQGQNFAPLRQMFYSMILASWYKLALKDALLNMVYSNKDKTGGVLSDDPAVKEKIYEQYLKAYKKGVFNYIKEEIPSGPHKYFSGGERIFEIPSQELIQRERNLGPGDDAMASGDLAMATVRMDGLSDRGLNDKAMTTWKKIAVAGAVALGAVAVEMPGIQHIKTHATHQTASSLEKEIERAWADPHHQVNQIKLKLDKKIKEAIRENTVIVLSGHNLSKIPIDADSFCFTAAAMHRLQHEAMEQNRQIHFVADIQQIKSDGAVYVLVFPTADQNKGWTDDLKQELEGLNKIPGKKMLLVGDNRFVPIDEYVGAGKIFSQLIVQDHHVWPEDFVAVSGQVYRDRNDVLLINNHQIFDVKNPDMYPSGAFQADLMRTKGDAWYDFLKALAMFGDKYQSAFPKFLADVDFKTALNTSEMLNFIGTYLYSWKVDGRDVSVVGKREGILKMAELIAQQTNFEDLHKALTTSTEKSFGDNFVKWQEAILFQVQDSIKKFLESHDRIFVYEVKFEDTIFLLVHKTVFGMLSNSGQFGDRVFVHYQVLRDGNVLVALARDPKFTKVDVSLVSLHGPHGIRWGGGHKERAGFSTAGKTADGKSVRQELEREFGAKSPTPEFVDKMLNFTRAAIASQMDPAMKAMKAPGGIDLNAKNMSLDIVKNGQGIEMKFDPAMAAEFQRGNFSGVVPVIIRIIPLKSVLPIMDLETSRS